MPDMEIISQLAEDVGADTALKLMAIFKEDADKRVQAIRDFLAGSNDGQDLRIQAHSLKGLCYTYGAGQAGDVAKVLQETCDAGDAAAIQAQAQVALDVIPGDVTATIEAMRKLADG